MYWRFGDATGDPQGRLFLFDEMCHALRYGEGPWVRLPHHPAVILKLLLRMQKQNRTVSSDQIRAVLRLPEDARIKDHVTELRKKLAEAGGDPARVLEHVGGKTGYRLGADVHANMLLEADALSLLDQLLAAPEPLPTSVRTGLLSLRAMLLLSSTASLFALALASWLVFRPDEVTQPGYDYESGDVGPITEPRTLIPAESVFIRPRGAGSVTRTGDAYTVTLREPHASACFELPQTLKLSDGAALMLELSSASPRPTKLAVSLEGTRPEEGRTLVPYELSGGARPSELRILARELDPKVRNALRRMCIEASESSDQSADAPRAFDVQRLRLAGQ